MQPSAQPPDSPVPPDQWRLNPLVSSRTVLVLLLISVMLAFTGKRVNVYEGIEKIFEGLAYSVGLTDDAAVASGWNQFFDSAFPMVFANKREVDRIENFDRDHLPMFSYIVEEEVQEYSESEDRETVTKEYLVEPFGFLTEVLWKMVETVEIAVWGTLVALVLAIPLAYFGARSYSFGSATYHAARAACSFSRALPELIVALLFVLLFGVGTIPGIFALGFHCSGFLGKFFADDIENTDVGPQNALRATGAGKLKVLRYAVLPQIMPQLLAYLQYILERNVRMATVLGVVGAGGIGYELKGYHDESLYGNVTTILLAIFVTVFLLEQITQRVRARLIGV
jgi:phosphonate transport system permease protein